MIKNTGGITLIALIITIIVLLILAGISISMITGEEGILQKVNEAKEEDEKAQVTEKLKLKIAEAITVLVGEKKEEPTIASVSEYLKTNYSDIEMTIEYKETARVIIDDNNGIITAPKLAIIQFEGWEFKLKEDLKLDETYTKRIATKEEEAILPENSIELLDLEKVQKVKIVASDKNGVDEIKISKGEDIIQTLTYNDNLLTKEEEIEFVTEFGKEEEIQLSVNGEVVLTTKITNMRYIRDAQDLGNFRDKVNEGNTFAGKEVELLNNIDLSTVCSNTIGSWEAIKVFAGTFNGNYYTIKNLYIKSNQLCDLGMFGQINVNSVIKNLVFENINIYNDYNVANSGNAVGGIVGRNYGIITNCGIKSGNVTLYNNGSTVSETWAQSKAGGIAGYNDGKILNSYNNATVTAERTYSGGSYYIEAFSGGICGVLYGTIDNCYNSGTVIAKSYGNSYSGGLIGRIENGFGRLLKRTFCYKRCINKQFI